ncbi:hypothetical protein [Bdellovibrio sp.]|uniref:hypothetical protein n=1 Tax=Bdellovibrio TaxID=958 RepID=UPI0032220616
MKKMFIFLLIVLFGAVTWASSYGRVRITVQQPNTAHHWNVNMSSNGTSLVKFSHALGHPLVVDLSRSHLNSNRGTTEISASYREFHNGETCKFQYSVEFSMNGSSWTSIGYFSAPNTGDRTTIPIGLCDGEVCSSDGRLQTRIEQQRLDLRRQEIRNARNNLEDSRRRLADLKNSLRKKAAESSLLKGPRGQNEHADLESEQISKKQLAELEELKDRLDTRSGVDEVLTPQTVAEQLLAETNKDLAQQQATDLDGVLPAEASALRESLQDPSTLAELSAEEQRQRKALESADTENLGDLLSDMSAAKVGRYLLTHPELFKEALAMGIRFTPAGDLIDACEAVTGAENCMPGGRNLGTGERVLSALGMLAGNRVLWSKMGRMVGEGVEEVKTLIKGADGLADSPVAKSIIRNQSEVDFKVIDRASMQLSLDRLEGLKGKLTVDDLNRIAKDPKAFVVWDLNAHRGYNGRINIYKDMGDLNLRISVEPDSYKIISVGRLSDNEIRNRLKKGRDIPLNPSAAKEWK